MTIQELINRLESIKQQKGNIKVLLSCDEEQNRLGDVLLFQVGTLTDMDDYNGNSIKKDEPFVVIVPNM